MNILWDQARKNVVHFFARPKKWTKERTFVEIGTHDETPPRLPEISVRKESRIMLTIVRSARRFNVPRKSAPTLKPSRFRRDPTAADAQAKRAEGV